MTESRSDRRAAFSGAGVYFSAVEIVRTALTIAAGTDVYTNNNIVVEEMRCDG